jgi:hypothetical protein
VVRRSAVAGLDQAACIGGRRGLAVEAIDETSKAKQGRAYGHAKRHYLGCAGQVANGTPQSTWPMPGHIEHDTIEDHVGPPSERVIFGETSSTGARPPPLRSPHTPAYLSGGPATSRLPDSLLLGNRQRLRCDIKGMEVIVSRRESRKTL